MKPTGSAGTIMNSTAILTTSASATTTLSGSATHTVSGPTRSSSGVSTTSATNAVNAANQKRAPSHVFAAIGVMILGVFM